MMGGGVKPTQPPPSLSFSSLSQHPHREPAPASRQRHSARQAAEQRAAASLLVLFLCWSFFLSRVLCAPLTMTVLNEFENRLTRVDSQRGHGCVIGCFKPIFRFNSVLPHLGTTSIGLSKWSLHGFDCQSPIVQRKNNNNNNKDCNGGVRRTQAARDLWWSKLSEVIAAEREKEPRCTNIQVVYYDIATNIEYVSIKLLF